MEQAQGALVMTADARFMAFWNRAYPETPPINYLFKQRMPDRWARIHSLPQSKRYAKTPEESAILLQRQNAVFDHLIPHRAPIRVVVNSIRDGNPLFSKFTLEDIGVFRDMDAGTVFQSFQFEMDWETHGLDDMLRMIADDEVRAFVIASECLVAPYDGGVDVILKNQGTRDAFKRRFASWLSPRADGL
jgi:hypothetical protein